MKKDKTFDFAIFPADVLKEAIKMFQSLHKGKRQIIPTFHFVSICWIMSASHFGGAHHEKERNDGYLAWTPE